MCFISTHLIGYHSISRCDYSKIVETDVKRPNKYYYCFKYTYFKLCIYTVYTKEPNKSIVLYMWYCKSILLYMKSLCA